MLGGEQGASVSGEPAQQLDDVIDMVKYLEETIAQIDSAVNDWQAQRESLALRLAAMKAARDPAVLAAAAEYELRVAENRPYEDAQDAGDLISEAHRRLES